MQRMTLEEYLSALRAQGTEKVQELCVVCPMCDTVQCAQDLIDAGAGATFDDVEKYLGFSCLGRFTHHKSPPAAKDKGTQVGCNWTLGGLFQMHELEVVTPDGEKHPRFMPATPEQAKKHLSERAKPQAVAEKTSGNNS